MMKKVKKSLAFLLALCMLLSLLPLAAFAAAEPETLPESEHNYANSMDQTWTYTLAGADSGVVVTFDDQTKTESGYDYIYIYDANDNEIGKYSGTTLAGASVAVPTAAFKIRLTSDSSANYYGFAVTSVVPVEKGNLEQAGTTSVADIPSIMLGRDSNTPVPVVTYMGEALTADTDFTVSYENNDQAGAATVIITGTGAYYGTVTTTFQIADADHLLTPASVSANVKRSLRQAGETGTSYITFTGVTDDWVNSIESITLTPVDADGSATDTGDAVYPHAPKTVTLTQADYGTKWYVNGNYIYFYRTAENPVVYVMEGHEPIGISSWGQTITYPQSQIYNVTVKADKYEDATGSITYYTGTAPAFSIIEVDEEGNETVKASWTAEQLQSLSAYSFANGSSQCGMTGFRTFSTEGVALRDLLELAGVTVSDSDYFLLDTSDHYGNNFTYDQLFGTTRYFLSGIYDNDFAAIYHSLVTSDDAAGATLELRRELANRALTANSTIEPRINVNYVETMISGDQVGSTPLPTAENTEFDELVSYENQFRFVYGIALVDTATVSFNANGGSAVASQTISVPVMTSTENTTIKSSYWANSLVIYRGQGEQYKAEAPNMVESITAPEEPTRSGYTFGGWYTDKNCTEGNEFDFTSDVTDDITLYAKWIANKPTIVDYSVSSVEHDDADAEANQIIVITVQFSDQIQLLSDDLSEDLDITIVGQNVLETGREITYAVDAEDATKLVITMRSPDPAGFYAVYGGLLNVNEAEGGIQNIVSAAAPTVPVEWTDLETYIPIGIELENVQTAGTAETPAATAVTVTHKANMRGMYHFQLLSNGVPVGDVTTSGYYYAAAMTSHAHLFYTSITKEYIANAIASGINGYCDGYTAVYDAGTATFTVTADEAKEGEVLTVQMFEYNADGRTVDPLLRSAVAGGQSYLDSDVAYTTASANVLAAAVADAQALIGTDPSLRAQADAKAAISAAIDGLEVAQGLSIVDFTVGNVEHDDADAEANQIIVVTVQFSDRIELLSDDLSEDIDILISGGNVLNTGREITYAVDAEDATKLVITMRTPDPAGFYAVFGGLLNVNEAEGGIKNIVAADGVIDATNPVPVEWTDLETYIPIGIELENVQTAGTAATPAATAVTVTHKANMRGMYHFQLLSNGVPVGDVTTDGYYYAAAMTSHAHLFYTSITKEYIANAIASGINSYCDGYTAVYDEGTATFTVTADEAKEGEMLTVQMFEYNADGRTVDPLLRSAVAEGRSYLDGDITYPAQATAVLNAAIVNAEGLIGTNPSLQAQADAKAAISAAIEGLFGSAHPYSNNMDESWTYTLDGAKYGVVVTFDEQTKTENNYDYIYIYDAAGNEIGKYTNTALAGASVMVPTNTFTIRLTSDVSTAYYGFRITGIEAATLPESEHNYASSVDQTWICALSGADDGVVITFDDQTKTESGYDFIYIYDANDNEIGKYSGTELAGASVAVPTATFKIRLTSDSSANYYGFKVTDVVPVEKGNLAQTGTIAVADIPSIMLDRDSNTPIPVVTYMGEVLTPGTDFTVSYENNDQAGTATVIITGAGVYTGTVTTTFQIADADHLLAPAAVSEGTLRSLRQAGETGTSSISFTGVTDDWVNSIESITLTPVDKDGTPTDTGDAVYPHAPKTITFTQDDYGTKWYVSGNYIYFYRTSEEPIVYVMASHEPLEIVGRWSTITYPQSQIYEVTVTADKYEDATGSITYYTGTAPAFSIIVVDEEGNETVAASWTAEQLQSLDTYSFANGSSQCGMTGFRTFSTEGVALRDLLELAGVEVSPSDSFLLDTSDQYGNTFTYEQLFGSTRYFMESIYTDPELAETYHQLVTSDDEAGATLALRKLLAEKALEANSTIEPRINVNYVETMISGDQVGNTPLPTAENTEFDELVSYENQFRFVYGIALTSDETATVTFNSNGGSAVEAQAVKASPMTSTENTTIKSSYWANSLVIYRGQGGEYTPAPADCATEPTAPTRSGYTFAGWYTDENCTDGNEFNFNSAVDGDITLYAKWVEATSPVYPIYPIYPSNPGNPSNPGDTGNTDDTGNTGKPDGSGETGETGDTGETTPITLPYSDVSSDEWYYEAAAYMYEKGIMTGVTSTAFEPNMTLSRATIVVMLHRLVDTPTAASANFADVASGQWYTEAVNWAAANSVVNGYGNGSFGPNDPITREQMAVILYRFAQLMGYTTSVKANLSGYTDTASVSDYATEAMQWAVGNGLITSTSTSALVLDPQGSATRAQIATILMRFMENVAE